MHKNILIAIGSLVVILVTFWINIRTDVEETTGVPPITSTETQRTTEAGTEVVTAVKTEAETPSDVVLVPGEELSADTVSISNNVPPVTEPIAESSAVEEPVVTSPVGFGGLISSAAFKEKLDSGEYVLLDIRTPQEYAEQRIGDDAVLINFYDADFRTQLDALDKTKKYLMHCRSGGRSSKATAIMQSLGFEEFYELRGGINSWNAASLPTFSG